MAKISVLGVDLGKNICSVVGLDASGAVVMRRKMRRETLIGLAEKLPACVVGMEACCGSHHLGRVFASHGHEVRLMSPEYVLPYVKAQKNDDPWGARGFALCGGARHDARSMGESADDVSTVDLGCHRPAPGAPGHGSTVPTSAHRPELKTLLFQ
jgi:hypothetical protein